jgi:integrase
MATIYLKLSKRVQKDSDLSEVIIRLRNGNDYDILAKSSIFVTADNFKNGEIKVNNRKVSNDVPYHESQAKKMSDLKMAILHKVDEAPKGEITKAWLNDIIDRFNYPEKYTDQDVTSMRKSLYDLSEEFIVKKQFSYGHARHIRVIIRDVARYERFISATDDQRKDFTFDYNTITKDDIEDFIDYLRDEADLAKEYPAIFEKLLKDYPSGVSKGQTVLAKRGDNTIISLSKNLKAFFTWLYETDRTKNRPFEGVKIGTEKYGTPYYITIEERNQIADYDFSYSRHLETQRDIFIFQCFIGCRVGDLMKFTADNITDGVLTYTPHKTKDESNSVQARIPLHPRASTLIKKYQGIDKQGRLFPFISAEKYNDAIKDIFTKVGIVRNVEIRNAVTGESELKPINEIASSHLARRTFVGNAYRQVADPNIIGKMSGHVEGSRAFARYRNIEDETLKDIINKLG